MNTTFQTENRGVRPTYRPEPWAAFLAGWSLVKIGLLEKLSYFHDIASDLFHMFVEILVFRQVWIALYAGREAYAGVTLGQALTYMTLNVIVVRLFSSWMLFYLPEAIRSGDIIFNISRPMYFGNILLLRHIGQSLTMFFTSSLPVFALVCLFYKPVLPASPMVLMAFGATLILGFLTAFFIDYLIALTGFWTTEIGAFFWAKDSVISILGGTYLPLWIFPPFLRQILSYLPFRGISYTPLAILIGQIGLGEAPAVLFLQVGWLIALVVLSRVVYAAAMKRIAIQGG